MKLSVVIPAYNEGEMVSRTVTEMRNALISEVEQFEIIVVDDGSKDGSCDFIGREEATVIRNHRNRGYGNALRTGIEASSYDWILICDADGSYSARSVSHLIREHQDYDVVIGARKGKAFFGTPIKRTARFFQIMIAEFVTGTRIPDVNSGFRLFRKKDILPLFDFACRGFSFTTSTTIAMILSQKRVRFVNVPYKKREGRSHVHLLRDTFRSLQIIMQCILRYNPIKAFLAVCIFEAAVAAPMLLTLCLTGNGLLTLLWFASFWAGIMFLTLSLGFVVYGIQNTHKSGQPVDLGIPTTFEEIGR